ncbi:mandelate racemase/muconate lactonizing enzyme family protein [Saccharopolyspora sp. K220]|uniref:mandelate racemase/muconate lactonizing enzyme family protein n=1 Tax=Saccharopolyspora soli TaxID=2926618 RepID=UPI001F5976A8|nr:mandelate racemase/muconate lactonizing enzyme family protein [Saccharopolyspora soli]MCI2415978.1 mandelate racemase/muconate lactonizing enzyme family protein [Saccharopolyspora soli]
MRIVNVTTAVVAYHGEATLVRIDTDEGISGFGEANPDAGAAAVVGLIHTLKDDLIGEDPRNVERCWEKLRRGHVFAGPQAGVFVIALSGIELALWDLAGKAAGLPVYRLLGGKFRDRIRLYADCGDGDDPAGSAAGCADRARRMVEEGFTALKFDIDDLSHPAKFDEFNHTLNAAELRTMVERVAAVREAVGPDIDLCIDMHARYDVPSACRIAWELEPFNLMWLEEPIPAENIDALVRVRAQTRTPICAGENLYLRWGFRDLLERGAVDVVMPDVPKCGGLAESKKIANLAEMHYVPFAPHLVSTPLGTMATSHQCAAIPNFLVQEWHALEEREVWDSYVVGPDGGSIVKDGYIDLPDAPGIGVELDMDGVRAHAVSGYSLFE